MGNSKNKKYRGNFTDVLFSRKSDDRASRFEIYFSSDAERLSYKNSDNEIIRLENFTVSQILGMQNGNNLSADNPVATMADIEQSMGVQGISGDLVDNTDPQNPVINSIFEVQPPIPDDDGSDIQGTLNKILASLRLAGIIEE